MDHSFVKAEAVKVSYRQTKDGMVVAFAIHPNDMPPELALAPVGTRVLLAVAELTDEAPTREARAPLGNQEQGSEAAGRTSSTSNKSRSEQGKAAYAMKDEGERAVTRAAMLCDEPMFQNWLAKRRGQTWHPGLSEATRSGRTAVMLREELDIESRREIAHSHAAFERFAALELEFSKAVGRFAEVRG
jgi:hypothetical protein